MKKYQVQDKEILIARIEGKYYASQNKCPHPLHGSQFDLSNGQVVRWLKGSGLLSKVGKILKSPRQLTTHNVRVEDDKIMIEI